MAEATGGTVDPALHCLRCDRDVEPNECHEANPVGSSTSQWWFHTCGDSIGASGLLPQGANLRDFVAAQLGRSND